MTNKKTITAGEVAEHLKNADAENIAAAYLALGITSSEDAEEIAKEIEEVFLGKFESDEEFAQEHYFQTMNSSKETQSWPYDCIDWKKAARDLMMDYNEQDGYYFMNV